MNTSKYRFPTLIFNTLIAGLTQGMLLPLLSILMERANYSSAANGFSSSVLYLGILLCAPFVEGPLRKYGYRPILLLGTTLISVSIALFPVWDSFIFWLVLRLVIGMGMNMLHFTTQVWITASSPDNRRGRNISLYGLSFGLGFAIGPPMTKLVEINLYLPFLIASLTTALAILAVFRLPNEYPENHSADPSEGSTLKRYRSVIRLAWLGLLPCLAYGFLESCINTSLPVYLLRTQHGVDGVAILLPCFLVASLLATVPQGYLSDRFGRQKILVLNHLVGITAFILAGIFSDQLILFGLFLGVVGLAFGSLFSLGISFLMDLLPKHLHPTGNLLAGMFFSVGSMVGPTLGGAFIQSFPEGNLIYLFPLIFSGVLGAILVGTSVQLGSFFFTKEITNINQAS